MKDFLVFCYNDFIIPTSRVKTIRGDKDTKQIFMVDYDDILRKFDYEDQETYEKEWDSILSQLGFYE